MSQFPNRRLLALICAAVSGAAASAQTVGLPIPTPSELTDRRPQVDTDTKRLPEPERALPRQLGRTEDETRIEITGYSVSPNAPERLRQALPQLTAPYVGKDKTLADMADAAREVTRFIQRELGYYLGLAYVPEQQPEGGVIRLEILEGRLDAIELKWRDGLPVAREVVEGYLAQLKPGSVLLVGDVERVVFLVNDLRGISADFEVRAGSTPGTATLVVTPTATRSVEISGVVDNAGYRYLGTARLGATVVKNSPFGLGDSLTGSVTASKGLIFGLANYTRPVGNAGARLGASLSALKYEVDKSAFPQGLEGTASTASLFGLYPYARSRNLNAFLVGTLDLKSYKDFDGATTNPKKVVNVAIGLTSDSRDSFSGGGINSFDMLLTRGHITFDTPLTIDAPDTDFSKLNLRAVRLQNLLPGQLQAYAAVRGQKAFANLDITEQFRAGGPDGVRAYPDGEGSGDNGGLITLELRLVPSAELMRLVGGRAFFSLFGDWARVQQRNNPSGLDPLFVNFRNYAGWGVAAVWNGPDGWDFRASIATPTSGTVQNPADETSVRVFAQLNKQF